MSSFGSAIAVHGSPSTSVARGSTRERLGAAAEIAALECDREGEPVKRSGSSVGEGGGSGMLRSMTGGSVFITNLRPFARDLRLLVVEVLRPFAGRGVTYTSRGGVKRSDGYW